MGNRWDEFSGEEHSQLATLAYSLLQQGAASWAIRSKASLLLALVIKRSGPELWEAALPQLLAAANAEGPAMQEQVGGQAAVRWRRQRAPAGGSAGVGLASSSGACSPVPQPSLIGATNILMPFGRYAWCCGTWQMKSRCTATT